MSLYRYAIISCGITILVTYLYTKFNILPPVMDGTSALEFRPVSLKYKEFIKANADLGSSLSIFYKNANVLDIHGGYMDVRFMLPWTLDTITQSFVLSSACIPLAFATLIGRNLIQMNDSVRDFLPWFSVPDVTIGDLLTHRAGFPYFLDKISLTSWRDDYKSVVANISSQVPAVLPKKRVWHYHSLALIADSIVRVVDIKRRTLGHFFMEELVWPSGIDLLIGIPRSQFYRLARTYHAGWLHVWSAIARFDFKYLWTNLKSNHWMPYGGKREKTLHVFSDFNLLFNSNPDLLEIPLASSNMFSDARNLARLFHSLLVENQSRQAFSSTALAWLLEPLNDLAYDPVLQRPLGLTAAGLMVSVSPEGNNIYGMWDDIMGQFVFVDPKRHLTVAYMTNHAHGRSLDRDPIIHVLLNTIYSCLPKLQQTD